MHIYIEREREREREIYNYCICIFIACTYAKEIEWSSLMYWYKNTNSKAVQILTRCIVSPLHLSSEAYVMAHSSIQVTCSYMYVYMYIYMYMCVCVCVCIHSTAQQYIYIH